MQLSLWTYEGPPHVGAMRVAASMRGVHYVLHAPQGDTYADLLFTMISRDDQRPPVTYTTFQARDLGGDTAALVKRTVREAYERFAPELLLVGESCTAELIQDQPATLAQALSLPVPVVALELPAYSRKENWGASETLYGIVRTVLGGRSRQSQRAEHVGDGRRRPLANILGPTALGFRCRDDVAEVRALLERLDIDLNVVAPLGASPADIARLPAADFNLCLYPEVAHTTCAWLQRQLGQPYVRSVPIGVGAIREFLAEVAQVAGVVLSKDMLESFESSCRLPWYSRSIDSTYLTGKRVFVFGDATHAICAARVVRDELGFELVGLGSYSREQARAVREAAKTYGLEALITDDYLEVEAQIAALQPELVLGTQMERHVAKRMGIPCAVISAPVHVQDFPARYSPQMGYEGANVLFDTWVHPLMMGLEEHLLGMFRDDFEFAVGQPPSHLGPGRSPGPDEPTSSGADRGAESSAPAPAASWSGEAENELKKVPFFVRAKARRNTERFALERGVETITLETLYDAKAHFRR